MSERLCVVNPYSIYGIGSICLVLCQLIELRNNYQETNYFYFWMLIMLLYCLQHLSN